MKRRRFEQTAPPEDRLVEEARRLRKEAELLPHGPARDAAARSARRADASSQMNEWLRSAGLRPLK